MMRWIAALVLLVSAFGVTAQDFTGLARLDVAASVIRDDDRGVEIDLYLSQPVPWRVFTLTDPKRLVLDFREIDWRGASAEELIKTHRIGDVRFGSLRPGWSRMVVDLFDPLAIDKAGMTVNELDGTAHLRLQLRSVTEIAFIDKSGAPPDPGWDMLNHLDPTALPQPTPDDGTLTVAVDPGHGGIDPGAERDNLREADLMLQLAAEVAETMNRIGGMRAVLTRHTDMFVPLEERMTIARAAGADLFISLHADALEGDEVTSGASVYTLSDAAQEDASERMAERHDRGDLLAGVDLAGQDDTVATVLMDLARLDTAPRSAALADELVQSLNDTRARVNSNARREALLAVLNAADFPSVLIEVGFLSSPLDRESLRSPEGRARVAAGIVLGIQRWAAADAARQGLRLQ